VSLPANELELWFWMESDRLLAPVFRGLDSERMVIEQERQRAESTPWSRQQAQFNALFWKTHPYRWPLFGWPAHVAAISVADIERHFQTYYSPSNLTAVLVGHLDRARIEELARRYFGRISARPEPPRIPVKETGPLTETRLNAVIEGLAQLQIRYHTVPFRHPDSYPLEVLAGLLNGARGRLQIALVQTSALAEQATAEQTSEQRGGFFSLIARASGDHEPEQLERAWAEVIDRLATQPVPQDEIERVKNRLIANYFRNLGSPPFLMVEMLTEAGLGEWKELDDHACRLAAVSAEDVRRVVRTYFAAPNRTVGLYRRPAGSGGQASHDPLGCGSALRGGYGCRLTGSRGAGRPSPPTRRSCASRRWASPSPIPRPCATSSATAWWSILPRIIRCRSSRSPSRQGSAPSSILPTRTVWRR